jgi:hypothetical protein
VERGVQVVFRGCGGWTRMRHSWATSGGILKILRVS